MSVGEAVNKLCPVFFMEGFSNPALEGAKIVNSDLGNVVKEETKVLDDVVLEVEERTSYWANIVTACCQHLLCRTIGGGTYDFSDEVHLSRCDHVTNAKDVVDARHPVDAYYWEYEIPT